MSLNPKNKIYIVGSIPSKITMETISRFSTAKSELKDYRMEIINPIDNFLNYDLSNEEAYKKNLALLLESKAIYLLYEPVESLKKIPELKLSFSLNLLIIHQKPIFKNLIL